MNTNQKSVPAGRIEAGRCPLCGQEQWGIKTKEGIFLPLRPGMAVEILSDDSGSESFTSAPPSHPESPSDQARGLRPWIPETLAGSRGLRLKYGVFLNENAFPGAPTGPAYQKAYLDKVRRLIEKEIHTPIAVILDRYFSAPHLASGDPKAVAAAMWHELDEIRRPAILMESWIENPDASNFGNLIHPRRAEELNKEMADEKQLVQELNALSLEEFLDLL